MIRLCLPADFESILAIINDGATSYRDFIPADRCTNPYMSREKLEHEIADGIIFYGYCETEEEALMGVMGIQNVQDVTLIRHAYVAQRWQGRGIGSKLLSHLRQLTDLPVLIGTWTDASWAIRFYTRHGFRLTGTSEKDSLLRIYWNVPEEQIRNSVVLADETWWQRKQAAKES